MITAVIFIKKISVRLPKKNFLIFADVPLYQRIINTLLNVEQIDEIRINTDSTEIYNFYSDHPVVHVTMRPRWLQEISHNEANEILNYEIQFAKNDFIFNTHTTNPLLSADTISSFIDEYLGKIEKLDCLIMADIITQRLYDNNLYPINHSIKEVQQTQKLKPVYLENSCGYLFKKQNFFPNKNRIHGNYEFFVTPKLESIDIDNLDDFKLASFINEQ